MFVDIAAARVQLTPTGALHIALNDANFLLVRPNPDGSEGGLAPALGREIAHRLDVPFTFVHYRDAGAMSRAVNSGEWDIGFLGIDPAREGIAFTQPYVEIEAGYLVPAGSPFTTVADVDRPGVRIAVAERSAYDLYLTRALQSATLVRAPGIGASYDAFVSQGLDVLAGLKPRLVEELSRLPGARILEGRFVAIQQGIGTPVERHMGAAYLRGFVTEVKKSGLLRDLAARLVKTGISIPDDPPESSPASAAG